MEELKEKTLARTSLESLKIPKSNVLTQFGKCQLSLQRGDIVTFAADAIVNVTSPELVSNKEEEEDTLGIGISAEIHKVCGSKLREACLEIEEVSPGCRCPVGEARITSAFDHKTVKFIIHTAAPMNAKVNPGEAKKLLTDCYQSCINLASEKQLYGIAFPLLCVGLSGFPLKEAVEIALDKVSVVAAKLEYPKEIWFVMKQKRQFDRFKDIATKRFNPKLRKKSNPFVEKGSTFRMLKTQKVLNGTKTAAVVKRRPIVEAFPEEDEDCSDTDEEKKQ